jgi:predicted CoA-binding protein
MRELIADFLAGKSFAVVGASTDRQKFGNKVLRCYMDHGYTVYPINPKVIEVEGLVAYKSLADLPELVHGISVVTPPAVTEQVISEAASLGITRVWMQPGAESAAAIEECMAKGMGVIAGGPCLLVELRE